MDMNKLTQKTQEALIQAQAIAAEYGHQQTDNEHVLSALLSDDSGLIVNCLKKMNADVPALRKAANDELSKLPRVSGPGAEQGKVYLTQRLMRTLGRAEERAKALKDEYVSVEHVFLAMMDDDKNKLFTHFGITEENFLKVLTALRGSQRVQSANPEATYEALEKYGRDLVEAARSNKLDPVIGRDEEIRRGTTQSLSEILASEKPQSSKAWHSA